MYRYEDSAAVIVLPCGREAGLGFASDRSTAEHRACLDAALRGYYQAARDHARHLPQCAAIDDFAARLQAVRKR